MKRVAVFCGASKGKNGKYAEQARRLGELLVANNWGLVYGGASVGLMGVISDTMLQLGGSVIGVIPEQLVKWEVANHQLSDLRIVKTMHQRKALMEELSDSFIAMPGGFGTLDELFEILTWSQLGLHEKPCGLLNTEGYYSPLIEFMKQGVEEQFIRQIYWEKLLTASEPEHLVKQIESRLSS